MECLVVCNTSNVEALIKVKEYNRDEIIKQFNDKTGLEINPTEMGFIKILPR